MIDICEKLFDVAFEHPYCPNIVFRNDTDEFSEPAESAVRAFSVLARIRVRYKCFLEKWRQFSMQCVMQKPVPNAGFMNIARFRIGDFEMLICRMRIFFRGKFAMERNNIRHEVSLVLLHIFTHSLSACEFFPRLEEIFERYDMIVIMIQQNFGHNLKNTPPRTNFAGFRQS